METFSRREFVEKALVATGTVAAGALGLRGRPADAAAPGAKTLPHEPAEVRPKSPTDRVPLGNSGVSVSVVGIGTGTLGWGHQSNQTRLGQETFTRLTRHAFDSGVTLFDLADGYGSHPLFQRAMEGVPREHYVIQTKTDSRDPAQARADIDRFLRELHTDYLDSLIIHCVTEDDWTTRFRGVMDVLAEAKAAGKIRSHGVTCHSLGALRAAAASDWVQVHQVRWNPGGSHMDTDVESARALFAGMRRKGQGMIGMKVVGQGDLVSKGELAGKATRPLTPDACFRFQVESGVVDAFVVGVETPEHVDRLLRGTQVALDELGYRTAAMLA